MNLVPLAMVNWKLNVLAVKALLFSCSKIKLVSLAVPFTSMFTRKQSAGSATKHVRLAMATWLLCALAVSMENFIM